MSLQPHPSFHRRHILSVKQFTHRDMYDLFSLAHEMRLQVERNGTLDILKGKVLCTVFYEPSTRTSSSFDAAMKRCGGQVVQITADSSSVVKGESLPDTIRTLGCYGDAIVIRHPDVGSAQLAAKFSPVPIINAGDGIGEHPTQVRFALSIKIELTNFFRPCLMYTQFVLNWARSMVEQLPYLEISKMDERFTVLSPSCACILFALTLFPRPPCLCLPAW
jgi:ornithine carbamoyltransferase